MDFWNSDFIKNLGKGQLPEVPVSLDKSTIVYLATGIFLIGTVLILFAHVINRK